MLTDPANHATYFTGCAIGHATVGGSDDLRQAGRAVGRAYQLFLKAGLNHQQAVDRITSLVETYGSLE